MQAQTAPKTDAFDSQVICVEPSRAAPSDRRGLSPEAPRWIGQSAADLVEGLAELNRLEANERRVLAAMQVQGFSGEFAQRTLNRIDAKRADLTGLLAQVRAHEAVQASQVAA